MRAIVGSDPLRVVVAGGSVAALEATLALRALAQDPIDIEVIAPEREFVYRPLAVTEPFRVGEVRTFPLARLVEKAGGNLLSGRVVAVDPARSLVFTESGGERLFDALLVALGAIPRDAVPGALAFSGPESSRALAALLDQALAGEIARLVFAVPAGVGWPLPLYELALLTRSLLVERGMTRVEVRLVSPEARPLELFGPRASDATAELLASRGVFFDGGTTPERFSRGALHVLPSETIAADGVVALPRPEGPRLAGLPFTSAGFIVTDAFCRVPSTPHVYAAGDATSFPLKQGGIAAQQADVAAAGIARRAGSTLEPTPFRPVLRGLLLTGMSPRFLRAEPGTPRSASDTAALWWPPAKIVGRHLAPFLASTLGLSHDATSGSEHAVPIEVELDQSSGRVWTPI